MKKDALLFFLPFFYFITFLGIASAQERLQSIEKGISLIGANKPIIQNYLVSKGFRFNNQTRNGDVIDYSRQVEYGQSHFGFSVKNQKIEAISWTENAVYSQDCLTEIKDANFQIELHTIDGNGYGDTKVFKCTNYLRNVLVTLIFRTDLNNFTVTIGKIDPTKLLEKSTSSSHTEAYSNNNEPATNYIVIAQKAYFYNSDNKGGVGTKRQAYLVEGETLSSLKEIDGYIYCVFTNSSTKKVSKGWLCKNTLEEVHPEQGQIQINHLESNNPLISLIKLDGKYDNIIEVFNNPVINKEIRKITGSDYESFVKNYVSQSLLGEVYVRHNVLYIRSFVMHSATINAHFFIDLENRQSFLYWNTFDKDYHDLLKTNGTIPLPPIIANFINQHLIDNKDFMDDNDVKTLNKILDYK
jgi:hypothetical protein